jgi:hypothetical protein
LIIGTVEYIVNIERSQPMRVDLIFGSQTGDGVAALGWKRSLTSPAAWRLAASSASPVLV